MPPPPPASDLQVLAPLDASICVAAAIAAVVLTFARKAHGISTPRGQFLADATSVWTIIVLVLISLSAMSRTIPFMPQLQLPSEAELIRSNGPLVPLAFLYCAIMIGSNITDSLFEKWGSFMVVIAKQVIVLIGFKKKA